jgi:hypothetical protein
VTAIRLLAGALALLGSAAACGSDGSGDVSSGRVDRCVARFVERVEELGRAWTGEISVEAYARRAYCVPLERRGWVHDDGTLSIRVVTASGSSVCVSQAAGEPARTVPCEAERTLDCGLLHLVRRSEVQAYVATLPERAECDDGTPLGRLGAD